MPSNTQYETWGGFKGGFGLGGNAQFIWSSQNPSGETANIRLNVPSSDWMTDLFLRATGPAVAASVANGMVTITGSLSGKFFAMGQLTAWEEMGIGALDGTIEMAGDGTWACVGSCLLPDVVNGNVVFGPSTLTAGTYFFGGEGDEFLPTVPSPEAPAPVPLPATAALLGLALGALGLARRKA